MSKIAIVGAGKIGEMICHLLISADYNVTLIDSSIDNLTNIPNSPGISKLLLDITVDGLLVEALVGHYAVINAAPFQINELIVNAAVEADINYLDLTEDVATGKLVTKVAKESSKAFIPQCGVAPGFIAIVANDIAQRFTTLDKVQLRVGALPQFPTNSLAYNLTWSTDGLINEYCNPCEAICDGEMTTVSSLSDLNEFLLDGVKYEAFNTSGGLGTLGDTLAGQVNDLSYQTLRYPGHRDIMRTLIQDLCLGKRRDIFKDILEHALPTTAQDVVVIFVTVRGTKDGQYAEESYTNKVYSQEINGKECTAIQVTTATGVCTALDLLREGKLPQSGRIRQEQINLQDFLNNRFGSYYK